MKVLSSLSLISPTHRHFLHFVAVNSRVVGKLVEVGVKHYHLVALLHCALDVLNLRSFTETIVHYQTNTSQATQRNTPAKVKRETDKIPLDIIPRTKSPCHGTNGQRGAFCQAVLGRGFCPGGIMSRGLCPGFRKNTR